MTARHGEVWIAGLDKVRPVVILTRSVAIPRLSRVTVAPVTSTIRGVSTEVAVGPDEGLDHDSVVSCDNIVTISQTDLRHRVGTLDIEARAALHEAVRVALELD